MRVVVTGATGFVGSHLVDALVAGGHDVTCLVRSTSSLAHLRSLAIAIRELPLDDGPELRDALAGADVVFHAAGAIKALRPIDFVRANVLATRTVAAACRDAVPRPRRMVLVSSQAAAGPSHGGRARIEDDAPEPTSDYGRSKLAAEREALAVANTLEVAIVRPCVVYGPRDRALFPLFRLVRWGIAPRLPTNPAVSLIHVDDLVACLLAAAEAPAAAGRTYFATGPPTTVNDLVAMIGDALGVRPFRVPIPHAGLIAAGLASDLFCRATGRPRAFGSDKARDILQRSWLCSPDRAATEQLFRARIRHEEGLAATARWYQENGWFSLL